MIDKNVLLRIAPNAKREIVEDLEKYFDKHLHRYDVNTYLRVCHFLAQCAHESASFRTLEEYASGAAYEGRRDLGNTQPGDGRRFKGRGIIQLTGRANYRTYGNLLGVDLENYPLRAMDPEISVLTALEYWKSKKLNAHADRDDILTITRRINGGTNGLADRQKYLDRAKDVLKNVDFSDRSTSPSSTVVARRGEKSDYIKNIQSMLKTKGYGLSVDGDFGPRTEDIIRQFQADNGIPITGVVDTVTIERLVR